MLLEGECVSLRASKDNRKKEMLKRNQRIAKKNKEANGVLTTVRFAVDVTLFGIPWFDDLCSPFKVPDLSICKHGSRGYVDGFIMDFGFHGF